MDTIESEVPPFHYGSHYSSAGAVLFWLGLGLGSGSGVGLGLANPTLTLT